MVENGVKVLENLKTSPYDLILMDVEMPEMDGYETMRAIRNMEQFRTLPIIALTAKAMKGDREKCVEAGASDYISKPANIDQLLSLLRVWLYRWGMEALTSKGSESYRGAMVQLSGRWGHEAEAGDHLLTSAATVFATIY